MLTLGQGQATPGTVIIVSVTCADLGLLEPFHVWEAMRSWKTLLGALAKRGQMALSSAFVYTVLYLVKMNQMETHVY